MVADPVRCPVCGAELPADAPGQPCPACLMKLGLESWQSRPAASSDAPPTVLSPGAFVPPAPEDIARHFPQLEILELLGHGGMGAVYKARQKRLERTVALKIIKPDAAADPGFAERFAREARTLARLGHPNIVTVHDFGEVDLRHGATHGIGEESHSTADRPQPLFYFVMEYVEGVNLRQLLEQGRLDPRQALDIVPRLCDALQYAHDAGVVHRDIKPENILIDAKGRVKIADFGLAKLVRGPADDVSLTGTHQIVGTPRYMAPEQMAGSRAVDHRADIYSLGVVFYEMLTGELPIGRFEPPSSKVEVDVRLDEVVLRTLEQQPERRYQQASAIRTDLERISASARAHLQPAHGDPRQAAARGRAPEIRAARHILRGLAWLLLFVNLTALILSVAIARTEPIGFRLSARQLPLEREIKTLVWHSIAPYIVSPYILIPLATLALSVGVYLFAANYLKARHGSLVDADDRDAVGREVRGPATGLVVTGIVNWLALPLVIIVAIEQIPPEPMAILTTLAFVVAGLLISAGLRMQRLRGWRMSVAASIVAMLVTPGNVIGLPIGIWSLVVLWQPEIREAFRRRVQQRSAQPEGAAADIDATRADTPLPVDSAAIANADAAARQLRGPAAGLLLAGIATVLTSAAVVGWTGITLVRIASAPDRPQTTVSGVPGNQTSVTIQPHALRPHRGKFQALLGPHVLGLAAGALMIVAGLMLGRAESYHVVRGAAVLAVLPLWVAWPVALPAGVWALAVLARPGIRTAFERIEAGDAALSEALAQRSAGEQIDPRTAWAVGVCLVGSLAAFVPWTRLSIAGTSQHLLGIDAWHGIVSGAAFLIALHALLVIDLFRLARGARAVVMFVTAAVVATACGFHFESLARGFRVTERRVSGTGSAELMEGFEKMVEALLAQMWRATPHLGGYLSAALAVALVVLGVLTLRDLRRTPRPLAAEAPGEPEAADPQPDNSAATPVPESAGTLRKAFAAWWAERERWFTNAVKAALLLVYAGCVFAFFSTHTSFSRDDGFRHGIGFPAPWFVHEWRFGRGGFWEIRFASSWLVALAAFAVYYAYWRIRRVEGDAHGRFEPPRVHVNLWALGAAAGITAGLVLPFVTGSFRPASGRPAIPAAAPPPATTEPAPTLLEAAQRGQVARVRELLDAGASVNQKGPDGRTPLMRAVAGGHRSLALTLVLLGADLAEQDHRGRTAMMLAVERRDAAFLKRLRELQQIFYVTSGDERKAQLRALPGVDRTLIDGRDIDLRNLSLADIEALADENGETASIQAARAGDRECFGLVATHVDSLLARDHAGRNAVMHAAINGHVEWFRPLLDERYFGRAGGTNVFVGPMLIFDLERSLAVLEDDGKSALQLAEEHGHQEIARILREHVQAIVEQQTAAMNEGGEAARRARILRLLAWRALGDAEPAEASLPQDQ